MNKPEPFDLTAWANQLLAGMAHRHTPPTDDERPEDQQEQQQYPDMTTNTKD